MQVQPTHCLASLPPQKQPEPQGLPGVVPLQVSSVKVGRTSFRVLAKGLSAPGLYTPPPAYEQQRVSRVAVAGGAGLRWRPYPRARGAFVENAVHAGENAGIVDAAATAAAR